MISLKLKRVQIIYMLLFPSLRTDKLPHGVCNVCVWMIKHLLDAAMADIDLFSLAKIISNSA